MQPDTLDKLSPESPNVAGCLFVSLSIFCLLSFHHRRPEAVPLSLSHLSNYCNACCKWAGTAHLHGFGEAVLRGGYDVPCPALLTNRSRQNPSSRTISPRTSGQSDLFGGLGILAMPVWMRYLGVVEAKGPSPKHRPPGGRVRRYWGERNLFSLSLTVCQRPARGQSGTLGLSARTK